MNAKVMTLFNSLTTEAQYQVVVSLEDLANIVSYIMREERERIREEETLNKERATLSVDETITMLGVSKSTLWKWEKAGMLIPLRLGKKVLYKQSDIDEMLRFGKSTRKKGAGRPPKDRSRQNDKNECINKSGVN